MCVTSVTRATKSAASVPSDICSVQCAVCSVQCGVCSVQCDKGGQSVGESPDGRSVEICYPENWNIPPPPPTAPPTAAGVVQCSANTVADYTSM